MSRLNDATGFYNSKAWKDTRRNYRQSVGNLCERCLKNGFITPANVVHHKQPLNENNINDLSISLGWDNLQALCTNCHAQVHEEMNRKKNGRRFTIDASGNVTIVDHPPISV